MKAFDAAVEAHGGDFAVRSLRSRDQLAALLYGQIAGASSLRAIEDALRSNAPRLYHLGAREVRRSTLADANAKRPCETFADLFSAMAAAARRGTRRKLADVVRLLDSTKVKLSGLSGDWARFSADHVAAKIHVVYDPDAALPLRAQVTPDAVNDITQAREFEIEPGVTYVFDLGYYDYGWRARLDAAGCRFVTRLKTNTPFAANTDLPVARKGAILSDRIGHLPGRLASSRKTPFADPVREIIVRRGNDQTLRLVTNDLDASAEEIAGLYRQRWEIELFFRWIKQNLKIARFLGTSENAVKIQIYVALIAFLALSAAHKAQSDVEGPQAFARLVRINLMQRRSLARLRSGPLSNPSPRTLQLDLQLASC